MHKKDEMWHIAMEHVAGQICGRSVRKVYDKMKEVQHDSNKLCSYSSYTGNTCK